MRLASVERTIGALAALVFWLPPIRGRLHALAGWAGDIYERLAAGAFAYSAARLRKGRA